MFLEGERLYLRSIEREDLPKCQQWINNPEVRKFLNRIFPIDTYTEESWYESHDRGSLPTNVIFAIVLKDKDLHIGNIGIHKINWQSRFGTTGAIIDEPEYWGKGYGPEAKELLLYYAFNTLNLRRIQSSVLAINKRSLKYLKKSGYIEEGRHKEKFFRDGEWIDEISLAITARAWHKARQN